MQAELGGHADHSRYRDAAQDPAVADIIRHAEAVFIAGGNQARYVNFWQGTPVQDAINANIADGKPIGGTSAGLAVLGEFAYGCLKDKDDDNDLASTDVLPNPYHERVTLVRDFLKVPNLANTLTDSHFAKRDRMGRTLGFLRAWCRTAGRRSHARWRSTRSPLSWSNRTVRERWLGPAGAPTSCEVNVAAGGLPTQYSADHSQHFGLPGSRRRAF